MINFFIRTYGCQANTADSEEIAKYLKKLGCTFVLSEKEADLVLINTCAIREKAEQKLSSYLGEFANVKNKKPYMRIGIIGCVASYKKQDLYKRFDFINFVYGARENIKVFYTYITNVIIDLETIKQLYKQKGHISKTGQDRDIQKIVKQKNLFNLKSFPLLLKRSNNQPTSEPPPEMKRSFINIMTGCDKYCSYCIVPFTRGKEISYPMKQIINQIKHSVSNGAKEITLIGQNVNSYKDPLSNADFSELLHQAVKIEGEFWIRWISPHPQDMSVKLFDIIAQNRNKIPPYIHFPVQSGSNKILKLMRRNYSIEQYLEQIDCIRDRIPNTVISTDIIIGFPGETHKDYNATRTLIETVKYDFNFSFIYSPRQYTKAWNMVDSCSKEEKSKRLEDFQYRQKEISLFCNKKNIGKSVKVLVEKRLKNNYLLARTEGNIRVLFNGNDKLIGTFVFLTVEKAGPANLEASVEKKYDKSSQLYL
jgi:tRNA-2-methylthio-N6-dimethylallyladenosine synthase